MTRPARPFELVASDGLKASAASREFCEGNDYGILPGHEGVLRGKAVVMRGGVARCRQGRASGLCVTGPGPGRFFGGTASGTVWAGGCLAAFGRPG